MKFRILLLSLASLLAFNLDAQTKGKKQLNHPHSESLDHVHHEGCTLYANDRTSDVFIPFVNKKTDVNGKNGTPPSAVFDIDYFGFTPESQAALQFAFDALSNLVTSSVPIKVSASWEIIEGTALGFASNGESTPNGSANAWYGMYGSVYPAALADKLAGFDINEDRYDLELTINSNAAWHLDPTDNTNIGTKYDLATVMMHEIIHGIGFNGGTFKRADDGLGFIEFGNGDIAIYDEFLEDNNAVPLKDLGAHGTTELGSALSSGNLFFVIPTLDNLSQKIHAPLTYSGGSSIYHLDEGVTAPADNMMTPFAARGEIRSDPGVATQMLYEMGWQFTTIIYEPATVLNEDFTQNFDIDAAVISDLGFDTSSVTLVYSQDTFSLDVNSVVMTYNAATDKFEASIPAPNAEAVYQYKLEAIQNSERVDTVSSPSFTNSFYTIAFLKDNVPPVIDHTDLQNINSTDLSFQIKASVVDSFAMTGVVRNASAEVDTVYIEYAINGGTLATAGGTLTSDGFGEFFLASGTLSGALTVDDVLTYRIIAVDASEAANTTMYPSDGSFISVPVIEVFDPVTDYINDFENIDNDDFTLDRFQIGFVNGFASPVLMNRDHPYRTAGNGNTVNFSATLKAPIIIAADSAAAFIKFKEIVLVEGGEPGTTFGDTEYWDYVIIEAKKLSGGDWQPLVDGYDSNQQATWRATYTSNVNTLGTSSGQPNQNMYRAKEFSFLGGDSPFAPSDTVLVRFRLFSDPGANGWGWMIENLNIQNPDVNVAVEDFIETNDFVVYPNPTSTGMINVSATFTQSAKNLRTELRDIHGRLINIQQISDGAKAYDNTIDVSGLPSGVYFMTLRDTESAITRKVVKY